MNSLIKRFGAGLMALILVLSLVVGALPTDVSAATHQIITTPTGYTKSTDVVYVKDGNYIANWGARGEECVFLSTYAEAFYTGSNTFSSMSTLSGGTTQSNAPQSALYDALQDLMVSKHSYQTSYNATRDLYCYTDCLLSDYSKISSFYSGATLSGAWDGGTTWNREHTWPNSKGLGGNDENDIMMLRPTSKSENSSRGNTAYGISSGYYDPGVDVRGDCARIFLYVYTRWGNTDGNGEYSTWGKNGVIESVTVLLDWMEEDPVDTWEMGRNDAVQAITGTRNVFVDYPEYAWLLFGEDVPANYSSPSNNSGASSNPSCSHQFSDATCTAPKTCQFCGVTSGAKIDHIDHNGDNKCDVCNYVFPSAPVSGSTFVKLTSEPTDWTGTYLIVYESGKVALNGALETLDDEFNTVPVTVSNNQIVLDATNKGSYVTIEKISGGYTIRSASGYYIGKPSDGNGLLTSTTVQYLNTLSIDNGNTVITSSAGTYLRFNATSGQMRFRYYGSGQQPIALYKLEQSASECNHNYDSGVITKAPTCTAAGIKTFTCTGCGDAYTETAPATGHTWNAASCTTPKTCAVCGATEGVAAGHNDANGDNTCDVCGTSMGTTTPPTPPIVTENTYVKVTTEPSDWSGQYLIVYEDGSRAFNGSLTTLDAAGNNVAITIKNSTITLDDANANIYFTIAKSGDGYTIKSASGYYIGSTTNTSNKLASSKTTMYTSTLSLKADNSVDIIASAGSYLRFNSSDNNLWFRYFKSGTYTNQKAITLYKLVEATCKHSYAGVVTTAPTCTTAGVKTYTCSACGDSYTEEVAALGHTEETIPTVAPTCTDTGLTEGKKCIVCGETTVAQTVVGALGHTAAEQTGCTVAVNCTVCGAEVHAAKEHTYVDGKCDVCGAEEPNNRKDILSVSRMKTLSLEGVVYINPYIAFKTSENTNVEGLTKEYVIENGRILFWTKDAWAELAGEPVLGTEIYISELEDGGTYKDLNQGDLEKIQEYKGKSMGIPAKEFKDTVYYRTYIEIDGEVYYSDVIEYSVEDYCVNQITSSTKTEKQNKLRALCATMLNYGAAAQVQFSYDTENLANAILPSLVETGHLDAKYLVQDWNADLLEVASSADDSMKVNFVQTSGTSITEKTLQLMGAIEMKLIMGYKITSGVATQIPADATITYYFWNSDKYEALHAASTPLSKENASYVKSNANEEEVEALAPTKYGYEYAAKAEPIPARRMDDTVYFVAIVVEADGTEYCTGVQSYSPIQYTKNMINKASNPEALKDLCRWIDLYCKAAQDFLGKG